MSWVAGTSLATLALWAALVLTGLLAGTLAARWNDPRRVLAPRNEGLVLAAAGLAVVAWFANAGALIGNAPANALLNAHVPIAPAVGFRMAVLWATLPGAALTVGVTLLVWAVVAGPPRAGERLRFVAVLAAMALLSLGLALWFSPAPDAAATAIPPFAQSAAASVAPLFAVAAVTLLALVVATRLAGAVPSHRALVAAWTFATLGVGAEQVARSQLGIGPRDAVLLGSASSGLVLWLVCSTLLHRRVRSHVLRVRLETITRQAGTGAVIAHVGAALLVISFAAHAVAARHSVVLPPGGSVDVTDSFRRTWQLANQGVSRFDTQVADVTSVVVELTDPAGGTRLLTPEIHEHHGRDGRHLDNTISLRKSAGVVVQAVRILLVDADSLDVASVRVTFLPLPILWSIGIVLLMFSAVASLAGRASSPRG